jgi:enoyl-[acyl-carrier protein] reductase/trans-2-enoyl-CoA reductase (NAD+)
MAATPPAWWQGLHEGCIEQIDRMFRTKLFRQPNDLDDAGRLRLDDWELSEPVQTEVRKRWDAISTETLPALADLPLHKSDFRADADPRVVPDLSEA